jgi:hypothetical protein
MVTGTVNNIRYEAGEFAVTQGHKCGERGHYTKSGHYVNPIGFGNATICKASKLILDVEVSGRSYDVWVDRFFKDNWGRVTAGRRYAIEESAPDTVLLNENTTCSGDVYYTVCETDMSRWLQRAKQKK